jgi:tetratricopeptide (TPR) repeat protein
MRKFVRRHRVGVGAAALLLGLLMAFSVIASLQAARIAGERDRANREAETAQQVLQFLVGLFTVSDPSEARGNTMTAREVLDNGAATIDRTLTDQPGVQARLQATIGTVYMNLGLYREAEALLKRAVETYRLTAGENAPGTMAALGSLADAHWHMGRIADAEVVYAELVRRRERMLGAEHPDTLKAKFDLASAYFVQRRVGDAETLTRETLEAQQRVLGREHLDTLKSLSNLAVILHNRNRTEEALTLSKEALDIRQRVFGMDHPETLRSLHIIGNTYAQLGRLPEARTHLERALEGRRRVLGENHQTTLGSAKSLARIYRDQKQYVEAERLLLRIAELLGVQESQTTLVESVNSDGADLNVARELSELYTARGDTRKAGLWHARVRADR